jgi:hypothetical protein
MRRSLAQAMQVGPTVERLQPPRNIAPGAPIQRREGRNGAGLGLFRGLLRVVRSNWQRCRDRRRRFLRQFGQRTARQGLRLPRHVVPDLHLLRG